MLKIWLSGGKASGEHMGEPRITQFPNQMTNVFHAAAYYFIL